jgi:hypothetical protein
MAEFGFSQVRVSTRGLRFAAVMSPLPIPAKVTATVSATT